MTLEQTRDFVTNMLEARSHILQNPEYGGTEIDFWADRIKDFIDATLLAQHAVAEPVDMLTELDHVKYTGPAGKIMQPKTRLFKCPSCGKEFRDIAHAPNGILCPDCPPAHAAEQPKLLTEAQVREAWNSIPGEEPSMKPYYFKELAERLNTLLAASVATPPQQVQPTREILAKVIAGPAYPDSYNWEAADRVLELFGIHNCPTGDHADCTPMYIRAAGEPPLAPGEQTSPKEEE